MTALSSIYDVVHAASSPLRSDFTKKAVRMAGHRIHALAVNDATKAAGRKAQTVFNFVSGYTALKNRGLERGSEAAIALCGGGFVAAAVGMTTAMLCTAALPVGVFFAAAAGAALVTGMAPAPLHALCLIAKDESQKIKARKSTPKEPIAPRI